MNAFKIIPATEEYNSQMCTLMAVPMKGKLHLSKIREPDFFRGAHIQSKFPDTYLCRENSTGKIAGMYSKGRRQVYIDGELKVIRYASDLRIDQDYQGSKAFKFILNSFLKHDDELMQSVVIENNQKMIELINRVNQEGTLYHYIGKYNSYILPLSKRIKLHPVQGIEIRKASDKDVNAMQLYFSREAKKRQFYPHYDFQNLGNKYYYGLNISDYFLALQQGKIVGITGVWNQNTICKTLVVGYNKQLRRWRSVINFFNHKLLGGISLPEVGEYLRNIVLHTVLIKESDSKIFQYLLETIYKEISKEPFDNLLIGLSETSPLSEVMNMFNSKYVIPANYYLVNKNLAVQNHYARSDYYFELARM